MTEIIRVLQPRYPTINQLVSAPCGHVFGDEALARKHIEGACPIMAALRRGQRIWKYEDDQRHAESLLRIYGVTVEEGN